MSSKPLIQSVKGTREFYPEEMAQRNFIYGKARQAAQMFGYQEWDAPFIESIDLYAAKSGEELVKEQSYVFEDRGGDLVALRPELTPSLARMIAQKQGELAFPLRWWSFGPIWRYERPQKGRSREFFQWNVDMLGVNSPEADAELIGIAATFLKLVGLTPQQAAIFVNNRRLMDAQFDALGIPSEKRMEVSNLVDRRAKMDPIKWDGYALELGLSQSQLDGLKQVLGNFDLWEKSDELVRLFKALQALGVGAYVKFDPNIMRGLHWHRLRSLRPDWRCAPRHPGRWPLRQPATRCGWRPALRRWLCDGRRGGRNHPPGKGLDPTLHADACPGAGDGLRRVALDEFIRPGCRTARRRVECDDLPRTGQAAQAIQIRRPYGDARHSRHWPRRGSIRHGNGQKPVVRRARDGGPRRSGKSCPRNP